MLLRKTKSVTSQLRRLFQNHPKEVKQAAIAEWQKRLQFKNLKDQVYFLGRYRLINSALIAVVFQVSLNQASNAIATLEREGCLIAKKGQWRSILACRIPWQIVKQNGHLTGARQPRPACPQEPEIEILAEKKWSKRPSSSPLKLKLRDIIKVA